MNSVPFTKKCTGDTPATDENTQHQASTLPTLPLNQVLNGDCLLLLQSISSQSVDMILCDLPYGCTSRNKWDKVIAMEPLWKEYRRIIKPNGAIVLTGQGLFSAQLMLAAPDLYKYTLIWRKNKPRNFLNARRQPLRNHEDVLVFYKRQPTYNPQMTDGHAPMHGARNKRTGTNYNEARGAETKGGSTQRYPTSVIEIPVVNNDDPIRVHPTQKPVPLGEYLIKTFTNEGDVVLDNCCGSGAFLVAAKQLGRRYIGMEADSGYAAHAQDWISRTPPSLTLTDAEQPVDEATCVGDVETDLKTVNCSSQSCAEWISDVKNDVLTPSSVDSDYELALSE